MRSDKTNRSCHLALVRSFKGAFFKSLYAASRVPSSVLAGLGLVSSFKVAFVGFSGYAGCLWLLLGSSLGCFSIVAESLL